ncbi:hypothetical protein COHA_000039 [Chlorella ohadii]|uniref:NXPE C-terminal domain-containing protein n=1 Tax=Chlorella ohadii TaxID=2649997 RepID=A0AAD5H738_9CHLO|nr:hypothetical protein COHA_000039 [Chlorella ohadii]
MAGEWQRLPEDKCNGSDPLVASCTSKLGFARMWPRPVCGAHEYGTQDLRQLLKDKHVAIVGDSHGRHLFTWLVRMLDGSFDANIDRPLKFWQSARWDGQSDSGIYVKEHGSGDLHVALQWLTTLPPIAQHVRKMREKGGFPDVVVLSAGEWYHQEKRSVQQLHADVEDLSAAVIEADAAAQEAGKQVLWLLLTIPDRVPGRSYSSTYLTPPELVPRYNAALRAASMLHPRGPALLLDLQALAEGCLLWCSYDGIHANAAVYAATVQLVSNLLALPPAPPMSQPSER